MDRWLMGDRWLSKSEPWANWLQIVDGLLTKSLRIGNETNLEMQLLASEPLTSPYRIGD